MSSAHISDQVLVVLLAVHNRRDMTLSILRSLYAQRLPNGMRLEVIVADAGSKDNTKSAVLYEFPSVRVIPLSKDHYWASSMHAAWLEAQALHPDFFLWINDDVQLGELAILRLFEAYETVGTAAIVGGTFTSRETGAVTYGGYKRGPWWHRSELEQLSAGDEIQDCDALNGNLVLVPSGVDRALGGFPSGYIHGLADFAYTLEARRRGYRVVLAPGTIGVCSRNPVVGTWADRTLARAVRWRLIRSPKGLPFRQWALYSLRYGGLTGPLTMVSPYIKVLLT